MEKTIQEVIAERITKSGEYVTNLVAERLAQVEISKRVDTVIDALKKHDQLTLSLNKVSRNDIFTYVNGLQVEAMSKDRFEEIKKTKEKLERLTKLIDTALNQNTSDAYDKLAGFN